MAKTTQNIPQSTPRLLAQLARRLPRFDQTGGVETAVPYLPRPLQVLYRNDHGSDIAQVHHRLVWMILLQGVGGVLVDGQLFELRPGQSVLVLPFQSHYRLPLKQASQWLVTIFELPDAAVLEPMRDRVLPGEEQVLATVRLMLDAYSRTKPAAARSLSRAPLYLAMAMEQMLEEARLHSAEPAPTTSSTRSKIVREMTALIVTRLEEPLQVRELCDALSISENHLRTAVREAFGLTPKRLILQIKMHRAAQMLSLEGASVKQTAQQLGFASPYAFSRAFRRAMGNTAKSYKQSSDSHRSAAERSDNNRRKPA